MHISIAQGHWLKVRGVKKRRSDATTVITVMQAHKLS